MSREQGVRHKYLWTRPKIEIQSGNKQTKKNSDRDSIRKKENNIEIDTKLKILVGWLKLGIWQTEVYTSSGIYARALYV